MESTLNMSNYIKNYTVCFLLLFFMPSLSSAIEDSEKLRIYRESKFNIPPNKILLFETEAFEGSAESAYRLGRYYQYCLASAEDKKIAGVFYYIARCFAHESAFTKLSEILNKSIDNFQLGNEFKIFDIFSPSELSTFKIRNNTLSNFILYHYYKNKKMDSFADRYELLLNGKVTPRILKSFEYIDKSYPIGFSSKPSIALDEIPVYINLAFKGDVQSALTLMVYYRYDDADKIQQPYMRNLWIYISALLGNADAKILMTTYKVNPTSNLFIDIIKNHIRLTDGFEEYFVLLNYSRVINDKKNEEKYLKLLQKLGVDKRLLN